jgi:ribonuclease P protein component
MVSTFPKTRRLQTASDFDRVYANAKRIVSHRIAAFYCKNDLEYPRLGLSIPKRNIRKAVQRNTFKRIVRETFRVRQEKMAGMDIILVAYKGSANYSKAELHQYLEELWTKLIT